jgi:glucan phosphoethanolaminetransferase (alkaline phosphatase superfamily)
MGQFGGLRNSMTKIHSKLSRLKAAWPIAIAVTSIVFMHLPALIGAQWVTGFNVRFGLYWSLIFCVLVFAVLGSLKRVAWLSLLCIPLSLFELYVMRRMHLQSSENTYSFMLESNVGEALDVIGLTTFIGALLALIVLLGTVGIATRRLSRELFALGSKLRLFLIAGIAGLMLLELRAGSTSHNQFAKADVISAGALVEGEVHTATTTFAPSFPYGMPFRMYKFAKSRLAIKMRADALNRHRFGIAERARTTQDVVVVAFVGESSGRMNWDLFGGTANTTPRLQQRTDVIKLPDVFATFNVTRLSVPQIFNRKDLRDFRVFLQEGSVIQAFEELGFETHWVSNQQIVGPHDSPISLMAYQADHQHFLNASVFEARNQYDSALVEKLSALIRQAGPQFIVLHGMGSHAHYTSRYPLNFSYFPTNTTDSDQNAINAYNNSIRFTDYVLDSTLQTLAQSQRKVALMYVADHGENMPSQSCKLLHHDRSSIYTSSVPAFFWFSKKYREAFPAAVDAAEANANKKIGFSVWFETLLEMGGHLDLPINRHPGLLSSEFVSPQRWVMETNAAMRDVDKHPTPDKCGLWAPTPDALQYSQNPLR